MIESMDCFEEVLRSADHGRDYISSINEGQGVLVLIPDIDGDVENVLYDAVSSLVKQFGKVVIIYPGSRSIVRVVESDSIKVIRVSDVIMNEIMDYAVMASYVDTSIKTASFKYELSGMASKLTKLDGCSVELVVQRGLLGIIG